MNISYTEQQSYLDTVQVITPQVGLVNVVTSFVFVQKNSRT